MHNKEATVLGHFHCGNANHIYAIIVVDIVNERQFLRENYHIILLQSINDLSKRVFILNTPMYRHKIK